MSTSFFFRFFLLIQLVRDPNVYFKKLFRVVKFSCTNMNRGKMKNYRIISLILVWFIFIIQAVWTMITKTITEHLRDNYKVEPKLNKFQLHSLTAKLLYTFQILNEKVSQTKNRLQVPLLDIQLLKMVLNCSIHKRSRYS